MILRTCLAGTEAIYTKRMYVNDRLFLVGSVKSNRRIEVAHFVSADDATIQGIQLVSDALSEHRNCGWFFLFSSPSVPPFVPVVNASTV